MSKISDTKPAVKRLALLGNPNCGKSALFNLLTGAKQKVANYAGVTVDVKFGFLKGVTEPQVEVIDLPGVYSLEPLSEDERMTCRAILHPSADLPTPDLVAVVVDATRLRRGLRLVAALQRHGMPCMVLLTMLDKVRQNQQTIDPARLQEAIGIPVLGATGVQAQGVEALRRFLSQPHVWPEHAYTPKPDESPAQALAPEDDASAAQWCRMIGVDLSAHGHGFTRSMDRWLLAPWFGSLSLLVLLFLIFQAVFSWAEWPMQQIENATAALSVGLEGLLSDGVLKSLLIDGVLAGIGGVIIFLPQILILFFFILVLEESGYLPRAALLLDRMMVGIGLSGRSFIPLLSSFACAIPGVMAARTISDTRSRLLTMALAPLMTCSARLPVYALLIAAFIPKQDIFGLNQQGLVLFALYLLGIVSAVLIAWTVKKWLGQGKNPDLMIELPDYHVPRISAVAIGLWHRALIFLRRVGGIVLALTIILWALSSFPAAPPGATEAAIRYSFAGMIGEWLTVVFEPIGFNWQISIALIPALAAREVVVSALGTVYALSAVGAGDVGDILQPLIAQQWSLATGLSLLVWFVYAPQCLATLSVIHRETGGWRWPLGIAAYLFGFAYLASWMVYTLFS